MLPGKTYSPAEMLGIAKRRLWLLPLPLVTLFAALVFSSTLPDIFQSNMLIAIVPQRVPDEFVRSTVTMQVEERLNAITVQIMSRSVLEPLILEFDLYPDERTHLPMEEIVQRMQTDIDVGLERQTSSRASGPTAFHVRYMYPDPDLAARVTQRLGSIFVDQNARDRGAMALATDDFLQVQLGEARARLEAQEKKVEAFRQRHGNELPTQLQSNLAAIQSAQLQVQALVEAIARDRDRKLMLERLYQEAQSEPVVGAAPELPATGAAPAGEGAERSAASPQQQLAAARALLLGMEPRLTPQHPDMVRTKRLIAELEAKVAADAESSAAAAEVVAPPVTTPEETLRRERLSQTRAELESLERQTEFKTSEEQRLRALVAEYQRRIEAVPGVESDWAILNRDYETQQASYKELLGKSEASKVALNLEKQQIAENFRVLDPARVAVNPVSPKRFQISGIGLALGLALAVGIAVLLELKDASFRSQADVVTVLAVPVLALVPHVETTVERKRRMVRGVAACVGGALAVTGAGYVFWIMRLWTVIV